MNPFDRLKNLRREVFVKGQEAVAQEVAAQDHIDRQKLTQEALKAAAETLDLAREMAEGEDPYKQQLADLIRKSVVGAAGQVMAHPAPQGGREAIEANPFDGSSSPGNSPPSATSLPDSTPKGLPHEEPEKRGPGRPRKDGQPPKRRKDD